jgi:hypothetical protein
MARGDIYEAAEATGISLKTLKSKKPLCASDQAKYDDFQAQVAIEEQWYKGIQRSACREARIARETGVPVAVVEVVARLQLHTSVHRFPTDLKNPLLAEDNEHWTPIWNPKKGGKAPLYHLMEALADADWLMTEAMEGDGFMMEAIRSKAPDDGEEMARWIRGVAELREVVTEAWKIRIKRRGKRPLPDWIWAAAGFMRHSNCTKDQYHVVLRALEPSFGPKAGSKQWKIAWDDKNTDWANPEQALIEYQEGLRSGKKRRIKSRKRPSAK